MSLHTNADILSRWFDAMLSGDRGTFAELISDDAVWHVPGQHPLAGDYRGRAHILDFFSQLATKGMSRRQVVDVLGSDDYAVALLWAEGERADGLTYSGFGAAVCRTREGKIVEFWGMNANQAGLDRFLSPAPPNDEDHERA